jgi:hypothetical protein
LILYTTYFIFGPVPKNNAEDFLLKALFENQNEIQDVILKRGRIKIHPYTNPISYEKTDVKINAALFCNDVLNCQFQ